MQDELLGRLPQSGSVPQGQGPHGKFEHVYVSWAHTSSATPLTHHHAMETMQGFDALQGIGDDPGRRQRGHGLWGTDGRGGVGIGEEEWRRGGAVLLQEGSA